MALNLVLLALVAFVCWRLRVEWVAAKERQRAALRQVVKPSPAPPFTPLTKAQPVTPSGYIDIAQKMLFSKDRNPTVVVEPPPPPPPPPPPKPMPALPVLHGVMNLGDGPTAIMSEKSGTQHRGIRPGEKLGEFTLVAVNNEEVVLEWDGKKLTKKLEELVDRGGQPAPAPSAPGVTPGSGTPPPPPAAAAPGVSIGSNIRACQAGDASPAGTVADGMRKIITDTPFGPQCRWEPVSK